MNPRQEYLRLLGTMAVAGVLIWVLFLVLDGLRTVKPKQAIGAVMVAILAFGIGAFWMHKHLTCEGCQQRFKNLKRRMGMRLIE